ncbi:MAG: hypothetical protein ACPGRW_06370 [Flavobacteriaceae bacterium]
MVTIEQINEALKAKPELVQGVLPAIQESEAYTTLFNNKLNLELKDKLAAERSKQQGVYNTAIFDTLGKQPGVKEDGTKQTGLEFLAAVLKDYKDLDTKRDSISKDEKVKELSATIEALKKNNGNEYLNNLLEQTKNASKQREQELQGKINEITNSNLNYRKTSAINQAFSQLKLNPDMDKSIIDMVKANVTADLLKSSKLEGDKLVFVDADGKPILDPSTMGEKTAFQMLEGVEALKSIVLKDDSRKQQGGGAQRTIVGNIETIMQDGKASGERLEIPAGSFTTQMQFNDVAEKMLQQQGVSVTDARFFDLKDRAHAEYKVSELPQQ